MMTTTSDRHPMGESTWRMTPEQYWHGVPARFRDLVRYGVGRRLRLRLDRRKPDEVIEVREREMGALAWKKGER